jgi:hypothetical protein
MQRAEGALPSSQISLLLSVLTPCGGLLPVLSLTELTVDRYTGLL